MCCIFRSCDCSLDNHNFGIWHTVAEVVLIDPHAVAAATSAVTSPKLKKTLVDPRVGRTQRRDFNHLKTPGTNQPPENSRKVNNEREPRKGIAGKFERGCVLHTIRTIFLFEFPRIWSPDTCSRFVGHWPRMPPTMDSIFANCDAPPRH